jgi:lipoprotein NlpD
MTRLRAAILVLALLGLGGCSSMLSWESDTYVVQSGDTLYKIAWRFALDYRDLADWNNLGSGNLIYAGQSIRLRAPEGWTRSQKPVKGTSGSAPATAKSASARPSAPPPSAWRWPTDGSVIGQFGQSALGGNGIDISGRAGQPVLAAAGGEVVYSGSGLIGYGRLIIVKHNQTYLSAYGHNRELRVVEGDRVSAGQTIALMGEGPGRKPVLHFEIRRNGKPVDPLRYLPGR